MNAVDRLLDTVEWHELPPPTEATPTYATHQGTLTIGEVMLRVYVLNDGQRLIDAEDVQKMLGLWGS